MFESFPWQRQNIKFIHSINIGGRDITVAITDLLGYPNLAKRSNVFDIRTMRIS